MTLYTIADLEVVLEGMDKEREFYEMELQGVKMQIEPISQREGKIVRIFTTDCQQYLNEKLQPGKIIKFSPEKFL